MYSVLAVHRYEGLHWRRSVHKWEFRTHGLQGKEDSWRGLCCIVLERKDGFSTKFERCSFISLRKELFCKSKMSHLIHITDEISPECWLWSTNWNKSNGLNAISSLSFCTRSPWISEHRAWTKRAFSTQHSSCFPLIFITKSLCSPIVVPKSKMKPSLCINIP